jgi:hypothetical protein
MSQEKYACMQRKIVKEIIGATEGVLKNAIDDCYITYYKKREEVSIKFDPSDLFPIFYIGNVGQDTFDKVVRHFLKVRETKVIRDDENAKVVVVKKWVGEK